MAEIRQALAMVALALVLATVAAPANAATPLDGDGMWIWQLDRAAAGDPNAIAAQAGAHGVEVVVIKAAAGPQPWPQFSTYLVDALKQRGLRVCAYQFVFGKRPALEARVAADIVAKGADCLLIDAETEYEGRYAQAQTYIATLRKRIGPDYPVGMTSFPYVHYHPAFPYSVFLGPGGAQFDVPQMYWHSIGTSVDNAFATTYRYNRPYGRPIYPLGQVALQPPPAQERRFRRLAIAYGAPGVSWWSWQHAIARDWQAVGVLVPALVGFVTPFDQPLLRRGAKGDLVVWAQQHLRGSGAPIRVDGAFGPGTVAAVRAFQRTAGLPATGQLDTATWTALLRVTPARVSWRANARRAARAADTRNGPRSAFLPAVANELRGVGSR
jgi:putative peptidoglycan binding protein